jgi:heme-degrading monooxygenase HmoA
MSTLTITRFTLRPGHEQDGDRLEYGLGHALQALAERPEVARAVLLRPLRAPGVHTVLTWWRDADAARTVLRETDVFARVAEHVRPCAAPSISQTTVVAEGVSPAAGIADVVAVTQFSLRPGTPAAGFEHGFLSHAGFMRDQDGFVSHQFVRVDVGAGSYVNLGFWRDIEAYQKVMSSPEFGADARKMASFVEVTGGLYAVLSDSDARAVATV